MSKLKERSCKIYKPEIMLCPKCRTKLIYKHAISNKIIQFSQGKDIRIKNLGYACPECDDHIYFSQTANKMSFKGYTYSAKVIFMIEYYKSQGMGREEICDLLTDKGIVISNRNIDNIYNMVKETMNQDFDSLIKAAYSNMMKEFGEIRITVDLITIEGTYYVVLYDFFTGEKLAIWKYSTEGDELNAMLAKYINDSYNIKVIITIRNVNKLFPMIKTLAPQGCKVMSYEKF